MNEKHCRFCKGDKGGLMYYPTGDPNKPYESLYHRDWSFCPNCGRCLKRYDIKLVCSLCESNDGVFVNGYGVQLSIVSHAGFITQAYPRLNIPTQYALLIEDNETELDNGCYMPNIYIPILACPKCGRSLNDA